MKFVLFFLLLPIVVIASANGPKGKLVGHADIGPITPLERPGVKPRVPPQVYKNYTISIMHAGPSNAFVKSHMMLLVATLKLSDKGDFSTDLAPGIYKLGVNSTARGFMPPPYRNVVIKAGQTTRVTVQIDTGIR